MKRVITEELVQREAAAGRTRIAAPRGEVIITPSAWARARELRLSFDEDAPIEAEGAAGLAGAERATDPSGAVVVRGNSVVLAPFDAAGHTIGLRDLVTGKDGSPMTAGIMSWSRADNFPWQLGYDEIDLVLEGELHVHIEGRTLVARAGDVVFIPKGSQIVFATPHRVRVFYVTYPADWSAPQPSRPQK